MKKVLLHCSERKVRHFVEVNAPTQYLNTREKLGLWLLPLYLVDEGENRHFSFIEFKPDGTFLSYFLIDDISGSALFADPEKFTESFKQFLNDCIAVAMEHPTFIKAVSI